MVEYPHEPHVTNDNFRRSRFNNAPIAPMGEEEQLRNISRARVEDSRYTPVRKIFPEPLGSGSGAPKMHNTYFKD